jgi:hypothetical protein
LCSNRSRAPAEPALAGLRAAPPAPSSAGPLDVDVEVLKPDELVAQGKTLLDTPAHRIG